jgi:hypothetical protein
MSCQRCTAVQDVPMCAESLTIGEIEGDAAWVVLENVTTGNKQYIEATVTDNIVSINTDDFNAVPDHSYDLYVVVSLETIGARLPVTIDSTEYACFMLRFVDVEGEYVSDVVLAIAA